MKLRGIPVFSISAVFAALAWAACSLPHQEEKPFSAKELKSLYYTDLGPDQIDVSKYLPKQQANYLIFSHTCSQCHTLARAINSPTISRTAWDIYISNMRLRNRFRLKKPFPKDEIKAILDFLVYDSQVRKVKHREEFEALTRKLQRRFSQTVEERLRRLQLNTPPIPTKQP